MKRISSTQALFSLLITTACATVQAGTAIPSGPPLPPPCTDNRPDPAEPVVSYLYRTNVNEFAQPPENCPDFSIALTPAEPGVWQATYVQKISAPVFPYMMCTAIEKKVKCEASPQSTDVPVQYQWSVVGHLNATQSLNGRFLEVTCLPGNGTGMISLSVSTPYAGKKGVAETPVTCTAGYNGSLRGN